MITGLEAGHFAGTSSDRRWHEEKCTGQIAPVAVVTLG